MQQRDLALFSGPGKGSELPASQRMGGAGQEVSVVAEPRLQWGGGARGRGGQPTASVQLGSVASKLRLQQLLP